jgi:ferredoxin-NADP reductase
VDGTFELTVTVHPEGFVSRHLHEHIRPGTVLHLSEAQGEFVLPTPRPARLALISGGSGITPVLSMLRTLCDEGHAGEVAFIHYARTKRDWLYRHEVARLAEHYSNLRVGFVATREPGGGHLDAGTLQSVLPGFSAENVTAAVCGPQALIDAARDIWAAAPDQLLAESFAPPSLAVTGAAADGTLRFTRSELTAPIAGGTLLEQAEAAGLTPEFGCRMGICHTCTCRKTAGAVRDLRTGEVSGEEDEDIQLCVSVPAGDLALEI